MDKNQLISVVIPVYNSEKFLVDCIESVLNQTYKEIEIIAVNDGSTDDSLKILQKYSEKITILSQTNQGLVSALNAGINAMTGKWFKWFSPDDLMLAQSIDNLVDVAKNLENTIVYSNWDIIDQSGKSLRRFSEANYNDLDNFEFTIRLLDGQQINVNTTLIPSILLKKLQFRSLEDPVLIDYDFFLRASLYHKTKFHLIEKSLIKYRVHKDQMSHKNIVKSIKNLNNFKSDILSNLNKESKISYLKKLKEYQKKKPFSKKVLGAGLKLSSALPDSITNKILTIYLNKIRRGRT